MTPDEAARLFDAHGKVIVRVLDAIIRRNALAAHDAAAFTEWTIRRLSADDHAFIRKFDGRASLTTYLTVVIVRLYRDWSQPSLPPPAAHWTVIPARPLASSTPGHRATLLQLHDVRITAHGVVVGTTTLVRLRGLAVATLQPTDAFEVIEPAARALRDRLTGTMYWAPGANDFAECLAAEWSGPALGLETAHGLAIPTGSVLVVAGVHVDGRDAPRVLVDFRLAAGPVAARVKPAVRGDGDAEERPAA